MAEPDVRTGMPPVKLPREEFEKRFRSRFVDPAFQPLQHELDAIVAAVAALGASSSTAGTASAARRCRVRMGRGRELTKQGG